MMHEVNVKKTIFEIATTAGMGKTVDFDVLKAIDRIVRYANLALPYHNNREIKEIAANIVSTLLAASPTQPK